MDNYLIIALKFSIGMLVMILQINILGKYEFSTNSPLNQIQNYVLGGIIGGVIYNSSISLLTFLIVLLIWSLIVVIVKLLVNSNHLAQRLVVGNPNILIKNGQIDVAKCTQLGLSADQLMVQLRAEGITSIDQVKSVIMEPTGRLTILDKRAENLKFPIISNGRANMDVLELIQKDEDWLLEEVQKAGHPDISAIYLAEYVNHKLNFFPYPR
ncbi:DUF421 domain-containing protein [Streptococcus sp. DD13]|uniref:DUF421 domain-containing protein n=1 Tax=Streptococcus sp. DD13 TaxID=1777881 RepID=UPI000791849A|nr:DUF421 domain-containing protein [Streptococcus sp. DD13]KXT78595.1 putative membrane protein yetF [Streptococcus sp. DD13]